MLRRKAVVSRRRFLTAGLSMVGVTIAACQPQVVEKVVTQVVEKPVDRVVTQVVEKSVEVTKVVEKPVDRVVTQVVEKQVVVAPTALPAVSLEFWYSKPEFKRPLENIMKLFKADNPNVTISVSTFGEAFEAKLKSALASGTAADMWADRAQPGLAERVKDEQFLDLTGKVDTKMMFPLAVANGTDKGKLWAVCVGGFAVGMGYDAELFEKHGFKPPWDPLESTCRHASLSIL